MDYIRVHNPHGSPRRKTAARGKGTSGSAAAKRSKNPVPVLIELAGMAAGNPQRSKNGMAKRKKAHSTARRSASNPTRRSKKRSSNPTRRAQHRKRSRNPNRASGFAASGIGTLKNGFWALVGLVISRQLPQMALGAKNTGFMGYAANIIAAFLGSWLIRSFTKDSSAGGAALLGGGLYVVNRAIQDNFSPIGKVLSLSGGMGDAMALGEILNGDRTYFPMPVAYDNQRNPIIPEQIRSRPLPVAAGATAGMGAWRGRRVAA